MSNINERALNYLANFIKTAFFSKSYKKCLANYTTKKSSLIKLKHTDLLKSVSL